MTKIRTLNAAAAILILTLALMLSSCAGRDYSKLELDVHELARSLATDDIYNDSMHSLDENIAVMLYGLDEDVTVQAYGGSGATPEAVLVVGTDSEKDAGELLDKMIGYNDKQISIFADYNTQYQPEAKAAVIESYGKYVVYCVSRDADAVRGIIKLYTDK